MILATPEHLDSVHWTWTFRYNSRTSNLIVSEIQGTSALNKWGKTLAGALAGTSQAFTLGSFPVPQD